MKTYRIESEKGFMDLQKDEVEPVISIAKEYDKYFKPKFGTYIKDESGKELYLIEGGVITEDYL